MVPVGKLVQCRKREEFPRGKPGQSRARSCGERSGPSYASGAYNEDPICQRQAPEEGIADIKYDSTLCQQCQLFISVIKCVIKLSSDNPNCRFIVQKAIGYIDQQFKCLSDELKKKKTAFPRTIVYCTSIANCGEIVSFFQEELGGVADGMYAIYHSRTPQGIFYMESFPLLGKQMAL